MNASQKNILIIEDNEEMRENTAEILELAQYNVLTADNGKTGYDMIIKNNPDLIICDVVLPEMNGFDLLRALGKKIEQVPFLFLTARSEKSDIKTGFELGAADYLVKPFKGEELLKIVDEKLNAASHA